MVLHRGTLLVLMLVGLALVVVSGCSWGGHLTGRLLTPLASETVPMAEDEVVVEFYAVGNILDDGEDITVTEEQLIEQIRIDPLKPDKFCQALEKYDRRMLTEIAKDFRVGSQWAYAYQARRGDRLLDIEELDKLEGHCDPRRLELQSITPRGDLR